MAKKNFLIISCLTVMLSFSSVNVYADPQGVVLQVGYIDPNNGDDGQQKSPILVPEISLTPQFVSIFKKRLRLFRRAQPIWYYPHSSPVITKFRSFKAIYVSTDTLYYN